MPCQISAKFVFDAVADQQISLVRPDAYSHKVVANFLSPVSV